MPTPRPLLLVFFIALLGLAGQPAVAASQAGKVVYAFGNVSAVDADGGSRALSRGATFGPGDTIVTKRGRAQLRFSDGGFAALQPNTEYRIEDYHFEGEADGNERSFLNLIRGSVRLVTGLIGRANKQNFRLRTAVATIGIRGTSGKITHCEANCGERGPGTSLAGYGGEWDLNSGSFSGPVKPGQAKFCNGASCFDIPGFGQRSEAGTEDGGVLASSDDEDDGTGGSGGGAADDSEPVFQAGVQVGEEGPCVLGECAQADILVATDQVGAVAFNDSRRDGDTGAGEELGVVLRNGEPVAVVDIDDNTAGVPEVFIATTDIASVRTAVNGINEPGLREGLTALLDAIPASARETLASNPASVAAEDFGLTSDGQLLKGRWQDGWLLEVEANPLTGIEDLVLTELDGFRSTHFIFGPDPGFVPGSGLATYNFTGGTRSTSADGRTIGAGVLDGNLVIDFAARAGALQMRVRHATRLYDVLGTLEFQSMHTFRDDEVQALQGGIVYDVDIEGFLAGPNGQQAPRAAGLSYVIDTPVDIIGVAGFGLGKFVANPFQPVPNGAYVAFAHSFEDASDELSSQAFDFIVDGVDNLAFQQNGVVIDFLTLAHPICDPDCFFEADQAAVVLDGTGPNGATSLPTLGVSWARFSPGYDVEHSEVSNPLGSAHVIKAEAPTSVAAIPALGSGQYGTYNMLRGGTRPTVLYETNGQPATERVGQLNTAQVAINFNTGDVNASFAGSFPDGSGTALWNLSGAPTSTCPGSAGCFVRNQPIHSLDLTGQVLSSRISNPQASNVDCSDGCFISGHTHFDLIGANGPNGVVGAYQARTDQAIEPAFSLSGTYVLQGTVGAIPP